MVLYPMRLVTQPDQKGPGARGGLTEGTRVPEQRAPRFGPRGSTPPKGVSLCGGLSPSRRVQPTGVRHGCGTVVGWPRRD
eukprot:8982808-Pyramimonas_sp.AAC.1